VRRTTIATLIGLAALGVGGVAQAHEFKPSWGYGYVDESPFAEPSGALMPFTQAFPRGRIRDTTVDGRDVRLTVSVYMTGRTDPVTAYAVEEGDFKDVPIDRRLDIAPAQASHLRYDFCRFNPDNGAVDACEPSHVITRPAATATPTPQPAPAPTDADGDGVVPPTDCWDQNATVFPGAKETAGNGIDEDCDGKDAPGRVLASVKHKWVESGKRMRVRRMRVVDAPEGARVEVRCGGRRCAFEQRTAAVNAKGEANLVKFFKRGVRPKVTIDVLVTYPNMIGRITRFPVKRLDVPSTVRYCLPPDVKRPQRC
jgi:hypothetical protein